jgi:hypothetical protein
MTSCPSWQFIRAHRPYDTPEMVEIHAGRVTQLVEMIPSPRLTPLFGTPLAGHDDVDWVSVLVGLWGAILRL